VARRAPRCQFPRVHRNVLTSRGVSPPRVRPRSVSLISCLFIATGTIGFAYHATEVNIRPPIEYEPILVLGIRLLAIVSGVFMLRGADWARWLAIVWLAYHVMLSVWHSWAETVTHAVLLAAVAYTLFRPDASPYFRAASGNRDPHGDPFERLRDLASAKQDRRKRAAEAAEYIRAARGFHWVGLYDVGPSQISAIGWSGAAAPAHPNVPRHQGLNGAAVASREPVVVQDVRTDPRYLTTFGNTLAEAIFPVRAANGAVVGTIDVENDRPNSFTPDDERFLASCGEALAALWGKAED
jgi:putative methionine-R-sulfoxide reductase with GAF domain